MDPKHAVEKPNRRVAQAWETAEESDEGEEGNGKNSEEHISKGTHGIESKRVPAAWETTLCVGVIEVQPQLSSF